MAIVSCKYCGYTHGIIGDIVCPIKTPSEPFVYDKEPRIFIPDYYTTFTKVFLSDFDKDEKISRRNIILEINPQPGKDRRKYALPKNVYFNNSKRKPFVYKRFGKNKKELYFKSFEDVLLFIDSIKSQSWISPDKAHSES